MSYQQQPGYGQPPQQPQYGQQQQQYYPPPPGGQQQGYAPPVPPGHPQQQQQQGYGQQQQQPAAGMAQQSAVPEGTDSGKFRNLSWTIKHRNTNSLLNIQLAQGDAIKAKPGAMVHMSPSVQLQGKVKLSMKKLFTGGSMAESNYIGPGLVALAPTLFGDIVTLQITQGNMWMVGKDAMLAHTDGVVKDTKSQGLGKALFSGEDLFVYHFSGDGILWLTSYGAIETVSLGQGEQHIVDNGHLVAWNCNYAIERVGGGAMSSMTSGEGLVCRFTGPGTIYLQTRNLDEFANYVRSVAPSGR